MIVGRRGMEGGINWIYLFSLFCLKKKTQAIKISFKRKSVGFYNNYSFIYFSCFLVWNVGRRSKTVDGDGSGFDVEIYSIMWGAQELLIRQWNILPSRIECRVLASSGGGEAGRPALPSCICKHILRKKLGWVSGEHYKRLVLDKRLSSLPASRVTKWNREPQQCLLRSKALP